jgi:hypothetical protein
MDLGPRLEHKLPTEHFLDWGKAIGLLQSSLLLVLLLIAFVVFF